jgi:hypothetical protein
MAILCVGATCKASTAVSGATQTGTLYDMEPGTEIDIENTYTTSPSYHIFRPKAGNLLGLPVATMYIPKGKVHSIVTGTATSAEFLKGSIVNNAIALF